MNPKRWKWYTWVTTIYFILSLITVYRITGLRGGVVEILEIALLPGMIWLFFFTLYKAADIKDKFDNRTKPPPAKPPQR